MKRPQSPSYSEVEDPQEAEDLRLELRDLDTERDTQAITMISDIIETSFRIEDREESVSEANEAFVDYSKNILTDMESTDKESEVSTLIENSILSKDL